MPEVDAAMFRNQEPVLCERDGHTAGGSHAGDLPVVEEPEFVARDLNAYEVGAVAVVGDAAEVGEGCPERVAAERPGAA
ncbi:hypothetical protein [Streptomyces sp. NPDC088727]|uniref:hypothetical protein n=1 Tax=Streptomyces sp. NPDC088727 TaxID=3365875 RepID=UPI00382BBD1C